MTHTHQRLPNCVFEHAESVNGHAITESSASKNTLVVFPLQSFETVRLPNRAP